MKHKLNRLTALLLAVVMTFSVLLVPVEAASFADVSGKAWYKSAVDFVSEKGLMAGVSETRFAPETNMTRAMFVTVLARYAGVTVKNDTTVFSDVRKDKWYTGAVTWAAQQGLVSGVGDGRFAPNAEITRQDLCTILCKFLSMEDVVLKRGEGKTFTDANKIASYAKEAVAFCAQTGLIAGFEDGSFGAKKTATRAQVAAILKKLWTLTGGPVLRPAQTLREGDAGVSVTVNAPEGALPEDVDMTVTRITDEAKLAELKGKVGSDVIAAADISFARNGVELEPRAAVEVQISMNQLGNLKNPTVYHICDDGTVEWVASECVSANRSVSDKVLRFKAESFSVYVIVSPNDVPKVTVKFYDSSDNVISQQVIATRRLVEASEDDIVVFDPGLQIANTQEFEGWSTVKNNETAVKTIDEINASLKAQAQSNGSLSVTYNYYPILHTVARLRYLDQTGSILDTQVIRIESGSNETTVPINRYYTVLGSNQFFSETWIQKTNGTVFDSSDPKTGFPTAYGNGAKYALNSPATLAPGDLLELVPEVYTGYFLSFDENLAGNGERLTFPEDDTPATYTAPKFAQAGGIIKKKDIPNPHREGYTFAGWYADVRAETTPVLVDDEDTVTMTADRTLYARWNPATAKYTKLYWVQNVGGPNVVGAANDKKTYEYMGFETNTADTASVVSLNSTDTTKLYGFYFDYNPTNSLVSAKVRGDGRTVLHCKYDRVTVTMVFVKQGILDSGGALLDSSVFSINTSTYSTNDALYTYKKGKNSQGGDYELSFLGYVVPLENYVTSTGDPSKVALVNNVTTGGVTYFSTYKATQWYIRKLNLTGNVYRTLQGLYGEEFTLPSYTGHPNNRWLMPTYTSQYGYKTMFIDEDTYFFGPITSEDGGRTTFYLYGADQEGNRVTLWDHIEDVEGHIRLTADHIDSRIGQKPYKMGCENGAFYRAYVHVYGSPYNNNISLGSIPWQQISNPGEYDWVQSMSSRHYYWVRRQYDIDYHTNNNTTLNSERYYYEANLTGKHAGEATPSKEEGNDKIFVGWYMDNNSFSLPYETYRDDYLENKMPAKELALYAYWEDPLYRVHLNFYSAEDEGSEEEVRFRSNAVENVKTTWLLKADETIPMPDDKIAYREGYVFDGWFYKDSSGEMVPFNKNTKPAAIADITYGTKKDTESDDDFLYRMQVYGERTGIDQFTGAPYDDRWLGDEITPRLVYGKVEIYAKWRKITNEGIGIQVRYLAEEGHFGSNANDVEHLESGKFNDGDLAFGYPASTANREDMHFLYWELMDSEGMPTGMKVYPGSTFEIDIENAIREREYETGYQPENNFAHTHSLQTVVAVLEATCTTPAHDAGYYCAGCDTYFYDAQGRNIMPVTGGTHNWVKVGQNGRCDVAGTNIMECTFCHSRKLMDRPASAHTMSNDDVAATCTMPGSVGGSHCTACDYTVGGTVIPALGHDWQLDQTTTAPTCTQTGLGNAHCSRCPETINNSVIPAKGHQYDGAKTYTWEISANNGANWSVVSGTPVIEFANLSNYQLRCTASTTCSRPDCDQGANSVMTQQVIVSTCTRASDPEYGNDVTGTYSAAFDAPFASPQTQNVTLRVSKRVVTCEYPNGSLTRLGDLGPSDTVTLPNKSDLPADAQTIGNYEVIGWIVGPCDSTTAPSYHALGAQVHFDENTTLNALYKGTFDSTVYKPQTGSLSDGSKYVITSGKTSGYILKSNGNGNAFGSVEMVLNSSNYLINVPDSCEFTHKVYSGTMRYFLDKDGNYLTAHDETRSSGGYTQNYQYHYVYAEGDDGFTVRNITKTIYFYLACSGSTFAFSTNSATKLYFWYKSGGASYKYKTAPGDGLSAVSDELASARTIDLPETNASVLRDHSASQTFVSRTAPATKEADGKAEPANAAPVETPAERNATAEPMGDPESSANPTLTVLYRYRDENNELVPFPYKEYGEISKGSTYTSFGPGKTYCLLNPDFLGYEPTTKLTQGRMPSEDVTITVEYTRKQIEMPQNEKWILETGSELDPNEEYLIVVVDRQHPGWMGMICPENPGYTYSGTMPRAREIRFPRNLLYATPGYAVLPQPLADNIWDSGWASFGNPTANLDEFYIDSTFLFGQMIDYIDDDGYVILSNEGWDGDPVSMSGLTWKVTPATDRYNNEGYVISSAKNPAYRLTWDNSGCYADTNVSDVWLYNSEHNVLKTVMVSALSNRQANFYPDVFYAAHDTGSVDMTGYEGFYGFVQFEDEPDLLYDKYAQVYAHRQIIDDPTEEVMDDYSAVFFFKRAPSATHTVILRDENGMAFASIEAEHGEALASCIARAGTVAPEGYTVDHWTDSDGNVYGDDDSSSNNSVHSEPTRGAYHDNSSMNTAVMHNMDLTATYEAHFTQTYEIQLRAIYGPYSEDGKTHIYWYANNGTEKNHGGGARVMDQEVIPFASNVVIPVPQGTTPDVVPGMTSTSRVFYEGISGRASNAEETGVDGEELEVGLNFEGHIFVGWVKFDEESEELGEAHEELWNLDLNNPEDLAKLALIWDSETGTYSYNPSIMLPSTGSQNSVQNPISVMGGVDTYDSYNTDTVMADATFPYQKMVAAYTVVQPDYFYIFHSATGVLERREITYTGTGDDRKSDPVDLTSTVTPGTRYGGYYKTYGGVNTETYIPKVIEQNAWDTVNLSFQSDKLIALIDALGNQQDLTPADAEQLVSTLNNSNSTELLIGELIDANPDHPEITLGNLPKDKLIDAISGLNVDGDELPVLFAWLVNGTSFWSEESKANFLSNEDSEDLIAAIMDNQNGLTNDQINALIERLDNAKIMDDATKSNVLSIFPKDTLISSLTDAEIAAVLSELDTARDYTEEQIAALSSEQLDAILDGYTDTQVAGAVVQKVSETRVNLMIETLVDPANWDGNDRNTLITAFLGKFTSKQVSDQLVQVLPDNDINVLISSIFSSKNPEDEDDYADMISLLDSFTSDQLATALVSSLQNDDVSEVMNDLFDLTEWTDAEKADFISNYSGAEVATALAGQVTKGEVALINDALGLDLTQEEIDNMKPSDIQDLLLGLSEAQIKTLDTYTNVGVTGVFNVAEHPTIDGVSSGFEPYAGNRKTSSSTNFWTKADAYKVMTGMTEDEIADVNGETMRPEANKVYYLKEVPEVYLSDKFFFVYKNGTTGDLSDAEIRGIYMVTVVDDNYYSRIGFNIDNLDGDNEEGYVFYKGALGTSFKVSQSSAVTAAPIVVRASSFGEGVTGYVSSVTWNRTTMGEEFLSVPMWTTLDGVDVMAKENERHIDVNKPLDCLSTRMELDLEHAKISPSEEANWLNDAYETKVCIFDGNGTDERWLDVNVNNRIMIPDLGAHYKKMVIVRYPKAQADAFAGNKGDWTKIDAKTVPLNIDYSASIVTGIVGYNGTGAPSFN